MSTVEMGVFKRDARRGIILHCSCHAKHRYTLSHILRKCGATRCKAPHHSGFDICSSENAHVNPAPFCPVISDERCVLESIQYLLPSNITRGMPCGNRALNIDTVSTGESRPLQNLFFDNIPKGSGLDSYMRFPVAPSVIRRSVRQLNPESMIVTVQPEPLRMIATAVTISHRINYRDAPVYAPAVDPRCFSRQDVSLPGVSGSLISERNGIDNSGSIVVAPRNLEILSGAEGAGYLTVVRHGSHADIIVCILANKFFPCQNMGCASGQIIR